MRICDYQNIVRTNLMHPIEMKARRSFDEFYTNVGECLWAIIKRVAYYLDIFGNLI